MQNKTTTKRKVREATELAIIQIVLYSLLCINYRAIALGHYHWAALSDFVIASMNFFIIRKISKSEESFHQWVGYVIGSVIGSYSGIYISLMITQ